MVHDRDSLGIEDRVHIMVDISDDTKIVQRRAEITGVVRRRRWNDEEKGRIVAEAVAPDAVNADAARRHDLAPQHLSNWIRAARDGRFALPADAKPTFVPYRWNQCRRTRQHMNAVAPAPKKARSTGPVSSIRWRSAPGPRSEGNLIEQELKRCAEFWSRRISPHDPSAHCGALV